MSLGGGGAGEVGNYDEEHVLRDGGDDDGGSPLAIGMGGVTHSQCGDSGTGTALRFGLRGRYAWDGGAAIQPCAISELCGQEPWNVARDGGVGDARIARIRVAHVNQEEADDGAEGGGKQTAAGVGHWATGESAGGSGRGSGTSRNPKEEDSGN